MNKRIVLIVGPTGSGKSRSIKNLDPNETYIINCLNKALPFKEGEKNYNPDKKNIADVSNYNEIISVMKAVSDAKPEIKNLVLDDIGYSMTKEYLNRLDERGFEKYNEMGGHMYQILKQAQNCRPDLNVVLIFHEALDIVDGYKPQRSVRLNGQFLKKEYKPEEITTIVLYTTNKFDPITNKGTYAFVTNMTNEYPAKSPEEMFPDIEIPNDLDFVIKSMNSYYE